MLTVDVIPADKYHAKYDLAISSDALQTMNLPWDQVRAIVQQLLYTQQTPRQLRLALVMDKPDIKRVPLSLIEAADLIRRWDPERQEYWYEKDRDGSYRAEQDALPHT